MGLSLLSIGYTAIGYNQINFTSSVLLDTKYLFQAHCYACDGPGRGGMC